MNDGNKSASADTLFADARMLHRQGRLAEAEQLYRAAIERDARHGDAKEWLGCLCLQQQRNDEAIGLLHEAVELRPNDADFLDNLAAALIRAKRFDDAVAPLERALSITPGVLERRQRLGDLLLHLGRRGRAMEMYRQAIELDPHLRAVCRDTQQIIAEEERNAAIIENCRHILARYPKHAYTHHCLATALFRLGRIAEARRASEQTLVLDPTVPIYYHVLILTGDPKQNANAVSTLEALATNERFLGDVDRAALHFLLAKAYDDDKRIDDAFAHLTTANAIKRRLTAYDEARELSRMQATAAAFTVERLRAPGGSGCQSPLPVFVVGMPRSGTTLVEQILASPPDAYGAGESTVLPDLISQGAAGPDFPAGFAAVTPEALARLGESYVAGLAAVAPGAKRIVDKMPYNFLRIGLIHLALPRARIIHVKRDPLDTGLACLQQTFAGDVGFAYDQGELGRYYKAYEALMAHWRQVLPDGAMLEVQYEELVDDLPRAARHMVEYCGLEWDERCAEFHKNPRAVITASLYQVRQPVYRKAVGRAEAYKAHLAPLREALGLP